MMNTRSKTLGIVCLVAATAPFAGCVAQAGDGDEEGAGVGWVEIAPGVRQSTAKDGSVITDVVGRDGFTWLVDKLEGETRALEARAGAADPEERAWVEQKLRVNGERLADARLRLRSLGAEEPTLEPTVYKYEDKIENIFGCYTRAFAYHYHTGMVDSYALVSCPSASNLYTSAQACVGWTCASPQPNNGFTSFASTYSGAVPCVSGQPYNANSYLSLHGVARIAAISGTCFTYD